MARGLTKKNRELKRGILCLFFEKINIKGDVYVKKRVIAQVLALSMLLPSFVMADEGIKVNVNGIKVEMDQTPIIENGRTLVPLRAVAEALGCEVAWDNTAKTASFVQGDVIAVVTVGENYILVGDGVYNEEFPIDTPAVIINSRTMIPLRALSECFGFDVKWDSASKTVDINSKSMDSNDTSSAEEQGIIAVKDNMDGKVEAYAKILLGTVSIIEAVDYNNDTFAEVKASIEKIASEARTMDYDELVDALSILKEYDESLADMANDAGVSDIVKDYYEPLKDQLSEIMGE